MQGSSGAWQEKGREEGARDACRGEKGWRKVSLGGVDRAGEAAQGVWHSP